MEDVSASAWRLNPTQWAFVASPARFSFYVGGIGAGKTFAGAARAILWAAEHPGSLGLVGAPTYPMLRDASQRMFFDLLPPQLIATYSSSEERLMLRNGAEVLFRSLETPDRVRGLNLAWYWLDEAPLCGYYAWQVLKGRLRQREQTTAAWATGTPHGRDGFARDFELSPRHHHALYRAATYANAHNLPPDFIAELGYTGAFAQQEILGQFVAFEGLVYSFDASRTDLADPANPQAQQGHVREPRADAQWAQVIGGVDWGYTNPSAAVVFGLDGDGRAWQLDEFYQRRASLEETLLPALLDLTRRYQVSVWYCGPDEPEHIVALSAALAREGLPARALRADNSVRAGIQTVTGLLALRADGTRGLSVAPRCINTIAEYESYQYATAANGQNVRRDPSEQPLKQHDHALDATRYALHTALGQARATNAYLAGLRKRVAGE
ncbi:MAG: terminase family protein [Ktedonobacterales bacterium]